jgi:D-amino-acid dehydrogenase
MLREHRACEDRRVPDVVVVGGGLVGAACAYELARDGRTVVVLDRHDAARATDAGAGILSPETYASSVAPYLALADAAGDHYRALVRDLAELGVPDTGYAVCGALRVAFDATEDDLYAGSLAIALARHDDVLEQIGTDDAHEMFPPVADVRHALFNPRAARVDGRAMVAALESAARRLGADWRAADVVAFDVRGERVHAVETADGTVECGDVVVAGGAWTDALASHFGVRAGIRPVRGQIVHLQTGADTEGWPIVQPLFSHYLVPWPAGRVALGATVEDVGFDARPTVQGMGQLFAECRRRYPGLTDATFLEVRVGLRPTSEDDLPVLGAIPGVANAFVAGGHGANGLLLGPVSGRVIADLLDGRDPGIDLAPFAAGRFT